MHPSLKFMALGVLMSGLTACGKTAPAADAAAHATAESVAAKDAEPGDAAAKDAPADPAAMTGPLAPVLTSYLEIGDLLASDKTEGVTAASGKLAAALKEHATRPTLAGTGDKLQALETTDLEAARAAFEPVSAAIIKTLEADPEAREGLIKVLCPMTFGAKGGYWVQRDGAIRNPYEGSRMLACGAPVPWGA